MEKILVTGASGFIGRHVLPLFSNEAREIHALSRQPSALQETKIVWHVIDLLNLSETTHLIRKIQPTHLLHLAWYHEGHEYWQSSENDKWLKASEHLVKEFVDLNGFRLVIAGTCAENLNPISNYGKAKAELFRRAQNYCSSSKTTLAWGQIYFPYGPYQDASRLIPSILASLLGGQNAKCLFPSLSRDYIYVEDVAMAFFKLLMRSSAQGIFEIGSGVAYPLGEIAAKVAEVLGGLQRVEFGTQEPKGPSIIVANPLRLKNELGFEPQTDLISGIRKMIKLR